jgi:hypothetical protein
MAERIYARLERNGARLRRFPFILGNLAPDLWFSFIFRRHEYACSIASVKKTILRLYEGRFDPSSALFAYLMGTVSHYICDYFCYPHSPSFRGNLWDHIKYELTQDMPGGEEGPFQEAEEGAADFERLMDRLDKYVKAHDRDLALDAASARADIPRGTAVSGWLAKAVFCSAERRSALPLEAAGTVITLLDLSDNPAA